MKKFSIVIITLVILIAINFVQFSQAYQQQQNRQQNRRGQEKYYSLRGRVFDWEANYVKKAVVVIPEIGKIRPNTK